MANTEVETYWKTSEDSSTAKFTPDLAFASIPSLNLDKAPSIDVVLLGGSCLKDIRGYAAALSSNSRIRNAVYLIDASHAVGLDEQLASVLQAKVCLSFFVDGGFRTETQNGKKVNIIREKTMHGSALVGYSLARISPDRKAQVEKTTNGKGAEGQKLEKMQQMLNSGNFKCSSIPFGRFPSFGSYCWKEIVPFVAFDIVSVVYCSLNANDPLLKKILCGVYAELVSVARETGSLEFPDPADARKVLEHLKNAAVQYNRLYSDKKYKIELREINEGLIQRSACDVPDLVHAFTHGGETYAEICMEQLLELASKHSLSLPYLESLFCSFKRIQKLRQDKIFDWIGRKSLKEVPQPQLWRQRAPYSHMDPVARPQTSFAPANYQFREMMKTNPASAGLISIHPRFHSEEFGYVGSDGGQRSGTPSVRQAKSSLYRKASSSSYESNEDIAKSQKSLFDHANVCNLLKDTTSRYGDVDTISKLEEVDVALKVKEAEAVSRVRNAGLEIGMREENLGDDTDSGNMDYSDCIE